MRRKKQAQEREFSTVNPFVSRETEIFGKRNSLVKAICKIHL